MWNDELKEQLNIHMTAILCVAVTSIVVFIFLTLGILMSPKDPE